jgi:molybdate transport system substrate-binding protein
MRVLGPPAVLAFLSLLAACGGDGQREAGDPGSDPIPSDRPLLVLAASDLEAVFTPLLARWHETSATRVDVVFGSSGTLAEQIRHGAPADLFFSADHHFVDRLFDAGVLMEGTRTHYATGRLALVVPSGRSLPSGPEALADPAFGTVAIANPDHAPYGRAARETLASLGILDTVASRLVPGEHIAHALHFVRTGNADAGLVALGLVAGRDPAPLPFHPVDPSLHAPLLQYAAIVEGTPRAAEARAFLDFVVSEEGQALFARFGFEPPKGTKEGAGVSPRRGLGAGSEGGAGLDHDAPSGPDPAAGSREG